MLDATPKLSFLNNAGMKKVDVKNIILSRFLLYTNLGLVFSLCAYTDQYRSCSFWGKGRTEKNTCLHSSHI